MNNCYLCDSEAEIYDQDIGRRKIVRCKSCDYYEITNAAISRIQSSEFEGNQKNNLAKEVAKISNDDGEALIVSEGGKVAVARK